MKLKSLGARAGKVMEKIALRERERERERERKGGKGEKKKVGGRRG